MLRALKGGAAKEGIVAADAVRVAKGSSRHG